jgi:hypothetical protein
VIFGATREEKRVHVVHVGEECSSTGKIACATGAASKSNSS